MKNNARLLLFCLVIFFEKTASGQDSLSAKVLSEVVVTAQYAPTDARNAVFPVRVLKRERIERLGANNLEQLLSQELNLRVSQDMVLGSSLSMQGISGQNVKILVDGIPVIGRTDGNIDLGQINLANIERVEIIEGPSSVFYGTDALAGVVNLISKRGQAEKWKIGLTSQYEQFGESSLGANAGFQIGKNWLLLASGAYDRFEGFDTSAAARNQLWNPKTQYYGDASLRYAFAADNFIRLKGSFFNEEIVNDGDIRRPQFKPYAFDDTYKFFRRDAAILHEGTIFQKYYWNNSLGINFFRREKESLRTDIETGEQTPIAGEQDTTRFKSYTFRSALASKNAAQRWQWLAGFDGRHDQAFGQRIRDTLSDTPGESSLTDAAFIGSLRFLPTERTVLETGLRASWNSRYDGSVVPSFTVKQGLANNFDARATYARGFRSPDLKELFFYFVDASHYIIGNPNLKPEKSDNVQVSLNWDFLGQNSSPLPPSKEGQFGTVQLSGFWNKIEDKIELYEFVETDQGMEPVTGDTSTLRYSYFNIERYETHGTTLRASFSFSDFRLDLGGNVTGYYNPANAELPDAPRFTSTKEFSTALQWQHSGWNAGVWLRTNDRFVRYYPEFENGEPVARQRIISGYTNVDASFGKTFFKNHLTLQVGARNLLDVQSAAVTGGAGNSHSGEGSQAVSPGRSFWVRLAVNVSSRM
jgi:outer membrane receptor for ferrienterochelin and colicins